MKLVKKLLRLLPFIYLLVYFFILILNKNLILFDGVLDDGMLLFDKILTGVDMNNLYFGLYKSSFLRPIYNWIITNLLNNNINVIMEISFSILTYELYMSLMFLLFDVFNFILSVAERFINKGERSND